MTLSIVLCLCVAWSTAILGQESRAVPPADEALYLPNGRALRAISFGFRNVLSDLLWFKTISYFGKHFQTDRRYEWLSHMCNLIVDLDPRAEHVYRFGAIMLAWETGSVEQSNALLTKAVTALPSDWIFPYLRGFNYLFFLKDAQRAKPDLIRAATLPGVHPVVAELAAKKIGELENADTAESTLRSLVESASDPLIRDMLEKKLRTQP